MNVSARQFSAPGFVDGVRRILDSSVSSPGALIFKLTESVLLRQDERVVSDLTELKAIGVKLAIDDFGTGYSSLSYLRELPIDVLKMDKSFVDGIAVSEQRLALAEGIVQIARTLQLEVVAEGIESEVQRDLLIADGLPVRAGVPAGHADGGPPGGDARPDRVPPGAQPSAAGARAQDDQAGPAGVQIT